MIKDIIGIVISEVDYKESSKVINVFTKDEGIIGIMAHGCKKVKSNYFGISKLSYGVFHINYHENRLSTLIDFDYINSFKNIKNDIFKVSYASYLTELVTQVYKHENNYNIYDLFIASLIKIEEGFDYQIITNILELKLLGFLGIKPVIDKCVSCGSKADIVTISSYKGGYLCKNCYHDEKIVNTKVIQLIRMFTLVDISKISKLDISENVKKEINEFIDDYYDRYSGLYLKSKNFIDKLKKV